MTPETRYARLGDLHLAYQVLGDGPPDLLLVDQWFTHVDAELGCAADGDAARAAGRLRAADHVRQARNRAVRPDPHHGATDAGGVHGRHPGRPGRRGLGAGDGDRQRWWRT